MLETLRSLAVAQRGYFLRCQAIDLGCDDHALARWARSGRLTRVRHGVYAPTATWNAGSDTDRLSITSRAVLHRLGDGYALSHTSAAAVHGIDLHGVATDVVHVTALGRHSGRTEAGVVQHAGAISDSEITDVDGACAVSPGRAVVECGCVGSVESTIVAASSALRRCLTSEDELLELVGRMARWPGIRTTRVGLSLSDRRCESVGEARTLHLCWEQRLPRPECQVRVHDGVGLAGVTDFGWLDWRHVGEFDGLVKYGRANPWSTDPVETLVAEKLREDRIRDTGLGMSRWTWADLAPSARPRTAARLRQALERSRRTYSVAT